MRHRSARAAAPSARSGSDAQAFTDWHLVQPRQSADTHDMAWLAGGVAYSLIYLLGGWLLRGHSALLLWFRIIALLVPPMAGVGVITRRRQGWSGCQWRFWATMALGLMMSTIGLVGWTVDELMLDRETSWLGWYTVFALFGGAAPLFALLAQPHRGRREELTATTAVDMAGIAVM